MMNEQDMMDEMDASDSAGQKMPMAAGVPGEICVPAGALEVGDTEQDKTAPEVGDDVEVSLGGKVTRVEGGNIYFKPSTANGEPIGESEAAEPDEESALEKAIAESQAGQPEDYS